MDLLQWKNFERVWVYKTQWSQWGLRISHSKSVIIVLQATGDRPTDEDALEMIAEADIDGDGRSRKNPHSSIAKKFFHFFQ